MIGYAVGTFDLSFKGTDETLLIEQIVDILFVSKNRDIKEFLISLLEYNLKETNDCPFLGTGFEELKKNRKR